MKMAAKDLQIGDFVDLEGDIYADPDRDPANGFAFEYALVVSINRETPSCIAIGFEGFDVVGFPINHELTVDSREVVA